MTPDQITAYCLEKTWTTEEYPFGPSPTVLKVAGKMFALLALGIDGIQLSLKCDPVIAANLREQNPSIRPGYHLNKKHWNTVTVDASVTESDLKAMIDHSYELVVRGLPKSKRASIEWRM